MSISGMFMTPKSGAGVAIAGVYSCDISGSQEELAKDSGASAGYGDRDQGLADCTVTLRGWIDIGATAYSGVAQGALVSNLTVPLGNAGANNVLTMASGAVLGFRVTAETRGRIEFESTIKNKGAFTISSSV